MTKLADYVAADRAGNRIAARKSGANDADLREAHSDPQTIERNEDTAHLVQ